MNTTHMTDRGATLKSAFKKLSLLSLNLALSSSLLIGFGTQATAQEIYPSKPIKVVVPFPAGGATDILTRGITEKLSQKINQPIVIENKPGAGANIGAASVAKASPDGYTLLMGSVGSHSIAVTYYKDPGYNFLKDLVAVSAAGTLPNIVVTGMDVPANNLKELVALAKAEPGKLTCGSSGTGGLIHLTCEMFKVAAGVDILHIPYKGTSLLLPDLLSGRVTMALDTLPPYISMLRDKRVKALAITTSKRSTLFPEIPTVAESGYPGFESVASYGFFAPTGTPPAIIAFLNREINIVLKDPELIAKLASQGIDIGGSTPEALQNFAQGEVNKWAKVMKDSNIKPE